MNKQIKVVLTGASGMVGEGVLMECLQNEKVSQVLMVNRSHQAITHLKLSELIVPDFNDLSAFSETLKGFDACFYCAGKSVAGLTEAQYMEITYSTTMNFAKALKELNPEMSFHFVSGGHTDSTEQGKVMWARIKGKTENALAALFPGKQYSYRPGLMKPFKEQKNFRGFNAFPHKYLFPIFSLFFPACTIQEIGRSMINASIDGYSSRILEVADLKKLGAN